MKLVSNEEYNKINKKENMHIKGYEDMYEVRYNKEEDKVYVISGKDMEDLHGGHEQLAITQGLADALQFVHVISRVQELRKRNNE